MMNDRPHAAALALALWLTTSGAAAQDYAGRFVVGPTAPDAVLEVRSDAAGEYFATLSNAGYIVEMSGTVVNGMLQGLVDDEDQAVVFVAELQEPQLTLVLAEVDAFGQPVLATAQTLLFVREGVVRSEVPADDGADGALVVNGQVLSAEQQAELAAVYGMAPRPGRYWYDARSGLYGVVGYQAFGFMYPGHALGTLDRAASNGTTGILINGRELPESEWLIWSYMLGTPILPGAYWLDEQGNAGYEGSGVPLVNLYVAAQQNAYSGQGGSGDNFWSTRFSAGNSNADNSQGYVSVPGYGPVGYGF